MDTRVSGRVSSPNPSARGRAGGACLKAAAVRKKSPTLFRGSGSRYSRQRPTLPRTYARSTIGGNRLNFRVRNGNGCDPAPVTTGKLNVKDPQRLPGHTPGALGTGAPQGERRKTEYPATVVVRPRTRRCIHICAELLLSAKEVIGQAARLISTS